MECNVILDHLSAKLDGELSPLLDAMTDNHLMNCVECNKEWQALQKQEQFLQSLSWPETATSIPSRNKKQNIFRSLAFPAAVAATLAFVLIFPWLKQIAIPQNNIAKKKTTNDQKLTKTTPNLHVSTKETSMVNTTMKSYDINSVLIALQTREYDIALQKLKKRGKPASLYLAQKSLQLGNDVPITWLNALADINDDICFRTLVQFGEKGVHRKQALKLLGKTKRKEALPILLAARNNQEMQQAIIAGLNQMRQQSIPYLNRVALGQNAKAARSAIKILGRMKASKSLALLIKLTGKIDRGKETIHALLELQDPRTVVFFMKLTEYSQYREESYQALALLPTQQVQQFLLKQCYREKHRKFALAALAHSHDIRAIPHLVELAARGKSRQKVIEILGQMPENKAAPYLIAMLRHSNLRKYAHRALRKMTGQKFGPTHYHWQRWFLQKYSHA